MKQNILLIVAAVLITLFITGGGCNRYYKSAEKQLKEMYEAKIAKDDSTIAKLQAGNQILSNRIINDGLYIAKKELEVGLLNKKLAGLGTELDKTKAQIKNFTAGQAIKYFEDYAKIDDNKMVVVGVDTSVVVTVPSIKKVDSIFAEHRNWGLKIVTLDQIVLQKEGIISIQKDDLLMYKQTVANKGSEISLLKGKSDTQAALMQLDIDKYKSQRNKARTAFGGTVGVVVGVVVIKALLK